MTLRIVDNSDYLLDVAALTTLTIAIAAGGWCVTQIVKTKVAYRRYKKAYPTTSV